MYILWNYEMDEPIAVSKDKGLLQEFFGIMKWMNLLL